MDEAKEEEEEEEEEEKEEEEEEEEESDCGTMDQWGSSPLRIVQ